jgi:hypothetical protein
LVLRRDSEFGNLRWAAQQGAAYAILGRPDRLRSRQGGRCLCQRYPAAPGKRPIRRWRARSERGRVCGTGFPPLTTNSREEHEMARVISFLILSSFVPTVSADDTLPKTAETFEIQGHRAYLYAAPKSAKGRPWVWYAPTLKGLSLVQRHPARKRPDPASWCWTAHPGAPARASPRRGTRPALPARPPDRPATEPGGRLCARPGMRRPHQLSKCFSSLGHAEDRQRGVAGPAM